MIFILISTDPRLEAATVAHFSARSLHPISLKSNEAAAQLSHLDPARHYLLHDVDTLNAARALLPNRERHRTVSLGIPTDDGADLRLRGDEPNLFEQLERFVTQAMSAFKRPGWDEYFMNIAKVVGSRSNCMKRQVAAVVVQDHRIVATGYNGTPKGAKNCNEGGCPRCNDLAPAGSGLDDCLCNHAEENAIAQAAYHGISIRGATIYCTFSPCLRCTKLMINAGIAEVVYNARYDIDDRSLALLAECGVTIRPVERT